MYTKDKNTRITLRLNEEQFDFVETNAEAVGVSPSEFIRMMINLARHTTNAVNKRLERGDIDRRENEVTNFDNRVSKQ